MLLTAHAEISVTPESAGWGHTSLHVVALPAGGEHRFATGEDEVIVVPLSGAAEVTVGEDRLALTGRPSVFAGPTDVAYLGRDVDVLLPSPDGRPVRALRCADRAVRGRLGGCPRPTSRSSSAAPVSPAGWCATSAPPACWTRRRSSPAR